MLAAGPGDQCDVGLLVESGGAFTGLAGAGGVVGPPHWACRAGSPVSVGLESSVSGACDSAQSAIWSQSGAVGSVAFPAVTIR